MGTVRRRVARIEQMDAQGNVAPPGRALSGPPSTLLKISHKDKTKSIVKKARTTSTLLNGWPLHEPASLHRCTLLLHTRARATQNSHEKQVDG